MTAQAASTPFPFRSFWGSFPERAFSTRETLQEAEKAMHGGSSEPHQGPKSQAADPSCSPSSISLLAWTTFAEEPGAPEVGRDNDPQDIEVDAVLGEFGGDFRAAIRALLHDLAVLAGDFAAVVSRGYVRGGQSTGGKRLASGGGQTRDG